MKYKQVPIKTLNVGDVFNYLDYERGIQHASFKIVEKTNSHVVLELFGNPERRETYSLENLYTRIMFIEDELRKEYAAAAKDIYEKLKGDPYIGDKGYHEMCNSWIDVTAYEMAMDCEESDITFIGYVPLVTGSKTSFFDNEIFDIAFIAQDNYTQEIFWVHSSRKIMNGIINDYEEYEIKK